MNEIAVAPVLRVSGQQQPKPRVEFEGRVTDTPFALTLLLGLRRFASTILPAIGGAYLITDYWWPLLQDFRITLNIWEFPGWFGVAMVVALLALGILFWLFTSYDVWRSFQLVGEWQRRNVYRLGSYRRCAEKGFRAKLPLFESWGKPIDLRVRVVRWKTNLVVTLDDYVTNPDMAIRYQVSQEEPWSSETEVEDFDELVLTSAETSMPTVGSEFTLRGIQSEKAEERLRELCQRKVGPLGTILVLSVSDTGIAPETQQALNTRATLQAQAEGLKIAARLEVEMSQNFIAAAKAYHNEGYSDEPIGKIAERLRIWSFVQAITGGEGKSTLVIPSPEGLFRAPQSTAVEELVRRLTDQLATVQKE